MVRITLCESVKMNQSQHLGNFGLLLLRGHRI
ncbi:Uncharacterised protein [Vibrio cholerae]|nr:Uncharacterised protein [Vibrio cholerae]